MKVVSFFAGAGGLDLGFSKAGFEVVWANEYDKEIWETYEKNHPNTILDKRSIIDIKSSEVPDCDGIIGGPPCQSWSEAGALKGINDKRGQLFFEFISLIADKQPLFFLAENVSGMSHSTHKKAFSNILSLFEECGYKLSYKLLNASDYGVPQDRKRIFFVGYRKDLGIEFQFPDPFQNKKTLADAIKDISENPVPRKNGNSKNGCECKLANHEYMTGDFSPIYMSRNRVRSWDEVSFTIQAGSRHIPIHPQAPKMILVDKDRREFVKGKENLYRRLSVRECARIQTFPDNFIFFYKNISAGYKMIGNAVPVNLAKVVADKILNDLTHLKKTKKNSNKESNSKKILDGSKVRERMLELINEQ